MFGRLQAVYTFLAYIWLFAQGVLQHYQFIDALIRTKQLLVVAILGIQ